MESIEQLKQSNKDLQQLADRHRKNANYNMTIIIKYNNIINELRKKLNNIEKIMTGFKK